MELRIRKDTIYFFILSLPFVFLVGNRGATPDTQIYYDVLKWIDTYTLRNPAQFYIDSGMEIGFGWYSWVIGQFSTSPVVLFSIFSLLNFYFIFKTCKIISIPYIYSLFFYIPSQYFIMQQFMQMRQGLAVSVVIYAFVYIINRSFNISVVFCFLAAIAFHQSSILLIIFGLIYYFFRNTSLTSRKYYLITFWIGFLGLIVLLKFVLLGFLVSISGRLQSYVNTGTFNEEIALISLPNIRTFLILMVLTYFSGEQLRRNQTFRFFLYLMFVAMSIRIGFSEFGIMSGRLSTAFSYVEIFALPLLLQNRFNTVSKLILSMIYFLLLLVITLKFQAPYLLEMYFERLY